MNEPLFEVWVYLAESPLLWLTTTLVAYLIAYRIYQAGGSNPLLNPVAIAVALLIGLLLVTGTSYETYFAGAQFVHFLLGPATVALAVPIYRQRKKLVVLWVPISVALVAGILAAVLSALGIAAAWVPTSAPWCPGRPNP